MTPNEKALQLYRYYIDYTQGHYNCKQCCLIAVGELIKEEQETDAYYEIGSYWQEVKQEIENL